MKPKHFLLEGRETATDTLAHFGQNLKKGTWTKHTCGYILVIFSFLNTLGNTQALPFCASCLLHVVSAWLGPKYNHTPTYQVEARRGKKHTSCLIRRRGCIIQVYSRCSRVSSPCLRPTCCVSFTLFAHFAFFSPSSRFALWPNKRYVDWHGIRRQFYWLKTLPVRHG